MTSSSDLTMLSAMTYPGGKGGLYRQLISLFPAHSTYIESHLGGGAVMRNKTPAARNIGIDVDPDVIARWRSDVTSRLELVQTDATEFLCGFLYQGGEFVYADPPYVASTRRRARVYQHDLSDEGHLGLLDVLDSIPASVMVSGYASSLYDKRLSSWQRMEFSTGSHGMRHTEVVWMNYVPPAVPFDRKFAGENFRERQQIKRKQLRMQQRIVDLSPVERALLLDWVAATYGISKVAHA